MSADAKFTAEWDAFPHRLKQNFKTLERWPDMRNRNGAFISGFIVGRESVSACTFNVSYAHALIGRIEVGDERACEWVRNAK